MLTFIWLLIVAIYLAMAVLQYSVAPKLGPNPYFGLKIGYTLSSKEVWVKANKKVGYLMILHGLILIPFSVIADDNVLLFLLPFLVPLITISIYGIWYSARLLETSEKLGPYSTVPIKPIKLSLPWKISPLLLVLITVAFICVTYPSLPNVVAVHFDSSGNPNGWSSRETLVQLYFVYLATFAAVAYLLIYAGEKHPILVHSGIVRIGRDGFLKAGILGFDAAIFILFIVYVWIWSYANSMLVPAYITYMIIVTLAMPLIPIGYIIYRWRVHTQKSSGGDGSGE